jgi:hypothetical protein
VSLLTNLTAYVERIASEFNSYKNGTKTVEKANRVGNKTLATIESEYTTAANTAENNAVSTVRGGASTTHNTLAKIETIVNGKQDSIGFTPENVANKKTSLTDNSDTYYPSQKAVKTYVDNAVSGMGNYQGTWDASSGVYPGSPNGGDFYKIATAGTLSLGHCDVGDMIIYNSGSGDWDRIPSADDVVSVNGLSGAVTLNTSHIAEDTNLYYTNARADARITTLVGDTNTDLASHFETYLD